MHLEEILEYTRLQFLVYDEKDPKLIAPYTKIKHDKFQIVSSLLKFPIESLMNRIAQNVIKQKRENDRKRRHKLYTFHDEKQIKSKLVKLKCVPWCLLKATRSTPFDSSIHVFGRRN